MPLFSGKLEQHFLPLYNLNINLWPFKPPNVGSMCRISKIITFLEFLSQGDWSDIDWSKIQALLFFGPIITLWGHFWTPIFPACSFIRRWSIWIPEWVKNSQNITVRDFKVYFFVNSMFSTSQPKIHIQHYFLILPGDQTECPDQSWLYLNGSCYHKLSGANNWNGGKSDCKNLVNGAHLVVINSKIENDFVRGVAYPDAIWLGCWDEGHEGSWECSDQSGKTYDYNSQTGVGYWGKLY